MNCSGLSETLGRNSSADLLFLLAIDSSPVAFYRGSFCSCLLLSEKTLTSEELNQLQELLCNGYWAFECLTIRDYNDMICGICGVAPKVEMAQRSEENVLALRSVEVSVSLPPWVLEIDPKKGVCHFKSKRSSQLEITVSIEKQLPWAHKNPCWNTVGVESC